MRKKWTKEEEEFLKSNCKKISGREISNILNRTVDSVYLKCSRLKIKLGFPVDDSIKIGQNFGRLTVVAKERIGKQIRFLCKCCCGKNKSLLGSSLKRKTISSCGCYQLELMLADARLDPGERTFKYIEYTYKKNSRVKKGIISYDLTTEYFRNIIQQNCFWCDSFPSPSNVYYKRDGTRSKMGVHVTKECADLHWINVNGIDRVDSNRGYVIDNCVPSCSNCNYAKLDMNIYEWCSYIERFQPGFTVRILEKLKKAAIKLPKLS